MSNLPIFAQGVQFSIDTTPDPLPSFHPHMPRPPHGRSPAFVPQGRGGGGGGGGGAGFTPGRGGHFGPRGPGHIGIGGSHNTPRHFYDRDHEWNNPDDAPRTTPHYPLPRRDFHSQQQHQQQQQQQQQQHSAGEHSRGRGGTHYTPRHPSGGASSFQQRGAGNSGGFRGQGTPRPYFSPRGGGPRMSRQWTPRQPNFNNPYENKLTPRHSGAQQQRWSHTPRGGGGGAAAPLSTGFGPCAKGASQQTLAVIDAFVKPSMLDDPWRCLEQQQQHQRQQQQEQQQHHKRSSGDHSPDSSKKARSSAEPDRSLPSGQEADAANEEQHADSQDEPQNTTHKQDEKEFNLRDFIPKV